MDNLCHSLVGATLAESGLRRRTALGYATLVIGANLPDVDLAALPLGAGLSFRRGWTHGVLALVVLPFVLTGIMIWWARRRSRRGRPLAVPFAPGEILLLAFVSVLTHPALDFMNDYGMRWLMPFSGRWYYGDSLFIVDPWLWLVLGAGVLLSRRLARHHAPAQAVVRPARIALGLSAAYIACMVAGTAYLRTRIAAQMASAGISARSMMVAPVPADPFRRRIVVAEHSNYRTGTVSLLDGGRLAFDPDVVSEGGGNAAAARAAATPEGRAFLDWARFPFFRIEHGVTYTLVHLGDARYVTDAAGGFGTLTVRLPGRVSDTPADPLR